MNTTEPIEIDFLEFFKTGKFDYLKLGQTKKWILNNFPNPDGLIDKEALQNECNIWTYGDIELHFDNESLFLIYSDYWIDDDLQGGDKLTFEKWIFEDISKLNLLFVLKSLNDKNIDYIKKTDNFGVRIRLDSGIEMTFENPDEDQDDPNSNEFKITSFGLIAKGPNRWE